MYRIIEGLLDGDQVSELLALAEDQEFVDIRSVASLVGQDVGYFELLRPTQEASKAINDIVGNALRASPDVAGFAMPLRFSPPMLSRYQADMYQERHVDPPVSGHLQKVRTDIAVVVFLSSPESYDGGELIIDWETSEQEIKLEAGDAIIYENGAAYQVAEVSKGERVTAEARVQSLVKDPTQRQVMRNLYDALGQLREAAPDSEVVDILDGSCSSLMRMWSEI